MFNFRLMEGLERTDGHRGPEAKREHYPNARQPPESTVLRVWSATPHTYRSEHKIAKQDRAEKDIDESVVLRAVPQESAKKGYYYQNDDFANQGSQPECLP